MFSATGLVADGITTELGGEFIDTIHPEILGLAKHFGLELIDTQAPEEHGLKHEAFLFGGELRSEEEILAAFRDLAPRLDRDIRAASTPAGQTRFDRVPLAAYLDSIDAKGWVRSLLDVAFTTEYGLDPGAQSAMNLLSLMSADTSGGSVRLFGDSDERYKILGGNQRIPDALAREVSGQIRYQHRLESIASGGAGFRLSIERAGAPAAEVDADIVLLAVPFSILRRISVRLPLPPAKRRAIYELGYGTDAKLMVGVKRRIWREAGYSGNLFGDEPFQLAWDSSRRQPGDAGAVTMLCGGRAGVELGDSDAARHVERLMPGLERAWRGLGSVANGRAARFHWPSHPHTLAAYSCYRPGQWTTVRGHEFPAVGRLHFAGEHTSRDFQGFMEGGAETGKRAAAAILRQAGVRAAFAHARAV